jgi:hypothetical protein
MYSERHQRPNRALERTADRWACLPFLIVGCGFSIATRSYDWKTAAKFWLYFFAGLLREAKAGTHFWDVFSLIAKRRRTRCY